MPLVLLVLLVSLHYVAGIDTLHIQYLLHHVACVADIVDIASIINPHPYQYG